MPKQRPNQNVMPIEYRANSDGYFLSLSTLDHPVWLDSGKPLSTYGRFDILCAAPSEVLKNPSIEELEDRFASVQASTPSELINNTQLPFIGGVIGYLNYEFNAEDFGIQPKMPLTASYFGIYHWALIQDHKEKAAYLVFTNFCDEDFRNQIRTTLSSPVKKPISDFKVEGLSTDLSKDKYLENFERIKHHIIAGDTYQINYAQRFSGNFSGSSLAAYLSLRKVMPSPFSAYLKLSDDAVLSLSPERFIQIDGSKAKTQPIKGTAPRGLSSEEDKELAKQLKNSEKNRAENVMIVDLLRNDFSKSCQPNSVTAPKLFELESFANVHHLVSTVEGEISSGISPLTFFLRCFPGGSITGAPKKRAMEIIQTLEDHPRNIYCGAICYMSVNGKFDSNIAIRTLLINEEKIYCWGGGGIVADSDPEEEYQESLQKIGILIEALNA
ncbi:MAG: aminodeoxychorismate synthase component I [Agarilytica sp.]